MGIAMLRTLGPPQRQRGLASRRRRMKLSTSAKQWARSLTKVRGGDQRSRALAPVPALVT